MFQCAPYCTQDSRSRSSFSLYLSQSLFLSLLNLYPSSLSLPTPLSLSFSPLFSLFVCSLFLTHSLSLRLSVSLALSLLSHSTLLSLFLSFPSLHLPLSLSLSLSLSFSLSYISAPFKLIMALQHFISSCVMHRPNTLCLSISTPNPFFAPYPGLAPSS